MSLLTGRRLIGSYDEDADIQAKLLVNAGVAGGLRDDERRRPIVVEI